MTKRLASVVLTLLVGLSVPAFGQITRGSLSGVVNDPAGAAIVSATVTAKNMATGGELKAVTDSQGGFVFPSLAVGRYTVAVEAPGFRRYEVQNVVIEVSIPAKVTVVMEVGAVSEVVTVVGEAQTVVNTVSPELKNVVDRRQVLDLPLPTRNPIDLVRLQAGIAVPVEASTAFVHGLRGNFTDFRQDGINVQDNFVKTSAFFAISAPTVENTGEFSVTVGTVGPDAGFGAAQLSLVTPSGSNEFHGSAFEFHRNGALNANDFLNNATGVPRPFQIQNRFGVRAGGPVYIPRLYNGKNRTFVWGFYEGFRQPLSRSRNRTVLTESARRGIFRYLGTDNQLHEVNLLQIGNFNAINPVTQELINRTPLPNNNDVGDTFNTAGFRFNLPGSSKQNRYAIRGDHQLTQNHKIEGVYNHVDFSSLPDLLNGIEPPFPGQPGGSQTSLRQVISTAVISTFGTNKTNEARWGLQRAPVKFNTFQTFDRGFMVGFVPATQSGGITSPENNFRNLPQGRNTVVLQYIDNFAWVKGTHNLRFGGEARRIDADSFLDNGTIPIVNLGTNASNPDGLDLSEFPAGNATILGRARNVYSNIVGTLGSGTQAFNVNSPDSGFVPGQPRLQVPVQTFWAFYFSDQWRVRRNLTFNYGVRYEYYTVPDFKNKLILEPETGIAGLFGPSGEGNLFNPGVVRGTSPTNLVFAGERNGRRLYERDFNNFAPFVGFAWDIFGDSKTSLRGGFAVSYSADGFTATTASIGTNAGLSTTVTNSSPTGVLGSSGVAIQTPTFTVPITQEQNFARSINASLSTFDPNLRTPYVLQWSLGIEREFWRGTALEVRYAGNHAVKLLRAIDINEINIQENGFLNEFLQAQNNLAISRANNRGNNFRNQGLAGQVDLSTFNTLFGSPTSTQFGNSTILNFLDTGAVVGLADFLARQPTFATGRANLPLNFFRANPFASEADFVSNAGFSTYHGLEVEVRRRLRSGLLLQANYTFSKTLTDVAFFTSQSEFQPYRTIRNIGLDKNRASFDINHVFNANFLYDLPFGPGRWLGSGTSGVASRIIGGWSVQGIVAWQSGRPLSLTSTRSTAGVLNAFRNHTAVLEGITIDQIQSAVGVFRTGSGVFLFNPNAPFMQVTRDANGRLIRSQVNPNMIRHPRPGEFGIADLVLTGPRFFNTDFSIIKRTNIDADGRRNFEFRAEFFNVFNNPNFTFAGGGLTPALLNIDSTNFGVLNALVNTVRGGGGATGRIIQLAARFNW